MGRRKISIAPIQDDRNRNVTFGKRRNGLFKKAFELGILCRVDVAVLVWSHTGKLFVYSSRGGLTPVMDRYRAQNNGEIDVTGPSSYGEDGTPIKGQSSNGKGKASGSGKKRKRGQDSDDDDDEDDDEEGENEESPQESTSQAVKDEGKRSERPGSAPPAPPPPRQQSMHPLNSGMYPNQSMSSQQHSQIAQNYLPSHLFPPGFPYGANFPHGLSTANVNPALGNALGFYSPSMAAAQAAAAAMANYPAYMHSLNGTPGTFANHLQQAQQAQQLAQARDMTGVNGIDTRATTSYAPVRSSSANEQTNTEDPPYQSARVSISPAGIGGDFVGHVDKPLLHLTIGNQLSSERSSSRPETEDNPSNDTSANHQYGTQVNGLAPPMNIQDAFMTSPTSLFPEIYRQFAEAAAAGTAPRGFTEDDDGEQNQIETVFAWPSLSSSREGGNELKQESGGNNGDGGTEGGV